MVACTFTRSLKRGFSAVCFEAIALMARKKISTTIYITPEQNERLKLLHERTKVPVAVYIREGIDLVLDRHQDDLPGQLSLAATGETKK
jgi:predicted DNA-binding protein